MKYKLLETFKLVLIRMSSLFVMAVVLLFLLFKGDTEAVGFFSAITTIVAPLVMFCQYRYLEYLSLSFDKKHAFSTALYASLISYLVLALFLYIGALFFKANLYLLKLMLLYKFFELFSDIYIAFLSVNNQMKKAFIAVSIRVGGVLFSIVILVFINFEENITLVIFMLIQLSLVYGIGFLLDFSRSLPRLNVLDSRVYILNYYSYAFTSIFVSLNSLMPRYFFIMFGSYSALGIFSIVYLLSSNLVNILQYPISLKPNQIRKILNTNNEKVLLIGLGSFVAATLVFFLLDIASYFSLTLGVIFIFLILLIRGIYFTYSIANELKHKVNIAIIISALVATSFVLLLIKFYSTYDLNLAMFYVVLSATITTVLLSHYNKIVEI